MAKDSEALVAVVGEYAFEQIGDGSLHAISALYEEKTGELAFVLDLVEKTRAERHRVLNIILDDVRRHFADEELYFTCIFGEVPDHSVGSRTRGKLELATV